MRNEEEGGGSGMKAEEEEEGGGRRRNEEGGGGRRRKEGEGRGRGRKEEEGGGRMRRRREGEEKRMIVTNLAAFVVFEKLSFCRLQGLGRRQSNPLGGLLLGYTTATLGWVTPVALPRSWQWLSGGRCRRSYVRSYVRMHVRSCRLCLRCQHPGCS